MNRVPALLLTICGLFTAFGTLVGCSPAESQDASDTLTWTLPTTRTDNSPLPAGEIASVNVKAARTPAGPFVEIASLPGGATGYIRSRPADGQQCYVASVTDTNAQESDDSNSACVTKCPTGEIPTADGFCALPAPPNSPTNVTAE